MKLKFLQTFLVIALSSCSLFHYNSKNGGSYRAGNITDEPQSMDSIAEEPYRIDSISKKEKWFIIYASRNNSIFQILSDEYPTSEDYSKFPVIEIHHEYHFKLESFRDNYATTAEGLCLIPVGYKGSVMIEGVPIDFEGISDVYFTPNLYGLHYIPDSVKVSE